MSERDHVFERDMGVITLLLERLRDEQGIDYVLLSRGKYEGLADRVTELEAELAKQKQVVILLAFECAKIHGGSIPEWIRVTEDGVDSPQGQELLASIRQASEQIANAAQNAPQAEGGDGDE